MKNADDVLKAVRGMAKTFGREIDGEATAFFTEVLLSKLTAEDACSAIANWSARETRWPAPAQIIALVKGDAESPGMLAQNLMRLIGTKGYTWESTFRYDGYASISDAIAAEAGDIAEAVVARCGGWARFCREWGGEEGASSARAQLRGLCEGAIKSHIPGQRPALPAHGEKQPDVIGEFISKQKMIRAAPVKEVQYHYASVTISADEFFGRLEEKMKDGK